jgi:dipeptidase E
MKRIVLFSTPTPTNIDKVLRQIFPDELKDKVLAYMPSDGSNAPQKYIKEWKNYAKKHNAGFNLINISKIDSGKEKNKLLSSNILVISGGNTFKLLDNLRESSLDNTILEFIKKENFVLSGFSAGALILTPTIEVCNLPNYDKNEVGLEDLTGLGIVNFEVFPHYSEQEYKDLLKEYKKQTKNEVREITNENCIVLDL